MRAVSVVAAAVAGLAYWYFVAPLYAPETIALAARAVPWVFGRGWQLGGPSDAILYTPAGLIAARVFMRYITTNLVTLIALFGFSARPVAISNVLRCVAGIVILIPVHAAAILVVGKSVVLPASLWGNAAQAYSVFGCHAISFAIWSLLRPAEAAAPAPRRTGRRRGATAKA